MQVQYVSHEHRVQAPVEEAPHAVEALLDEELPSLPELELGQLDNGLRYVILPNKVPASRFEAHLEIHAGALRGCRVSAGPHLLPAYNGVATHAWVPRLCLREGYSQSSAKEDMPPPRHPAPRPAAARSSYPPL